PSAECPMIINGKNTPVSDVPLFHFYPLDQLKLKKTKKRIKSDQNQTKREAYRSPEQSKAVPVKKARKNKENTT
nr:hypothetical protein [Tanacetum cinerariifolium]